MAQIPTGNFGQTVVQPGRGQRVFAEQAGQITGRATAELGQTAQQIALRDMEQQTRVGIEAYDREAQTTAARVRITTQNKLDEAADTLAADIKAGRVTKDKADEEWEEVKAADIESESAEYVQAASKSAATQNSVETWESKVADLQKQVEAKEAELKKFKHDSEFARQERIKLLTDALTVGVPQATADLNKYIADADYYPEPIRKHMDEQIKVLADMCGDYLSRI